MIFSLLRNGFKTILSLLFIVAICNQSFAFQTPKRINLSSIYKDLISSNEEVLTYKNITINDDIYDRTLQEDSLDFISALEAILKYKVPYDSLGIISNVEELYLTNITSKDVEFYKLNLPYFTINNSHFEILGIFESKIADFGIDSTTVNNRFSIADVKFEKFWDFENKYTQVEYSDCVFSSFYMMSQSKFSGEFWIYDSRFKEGAYIGPVFDGSFTDFLLSGNIFEAIDSEIPIQDEELMPDSFIPKTQLRLNLFGDLEQIFVVGNDFLSNDKDQLIYIEGDFGYMSVSDNLFESILFPACTVSKQLSYMENEVTADLIFTELILQGKNNLIHWRDLEGFKLASAISVESILTENLDYYGLKEDLLDSVFAQTSDVIFIPYRGLEDNELEDEDIFQGLISSYYRIYKVFKENGQIGDANQTYLEMKDVQLRQLEYNYKTYGGLENVIQ